MKAINKTIAAGFCLALAIMAFSPGCKKSDREPKPVPVTPPTPHKPRIDTKGTLMEIDREFFIKNIWDYTSSPTKIVYLCDLPCIVDFWAHWCGPCMEFKPTLEKLAKEYENRVYFFSVDFDKNKRFAEELDVTNGLPDISFYTMTGMNYRMNRRMDEAETRAYVEKILAESKQK